MTIRPANTYLSATLIETGLWHIERYLLQKYGSAQAARDMEPLKWYIATGRASTEFIWAILTAKPFMIGRLLHKGGSVDEAIQRLKKYVGWEEESA